MRWSIICLIWFRELRDQLRDRRTMFTIVALPMLLYPLLSFLTWQFAGQLLNRTSIVAIVQGDTSTNTFPRPATKGQQTSVAPALSWLSLLPSPATTPLERCAGTAALAHASHLSLDYQPLIAHDEIPDLLRRSLKDSQSVFPGTIQLEYRFFDDDTADDALAKKDVDLIVSAPADFMDQVIAGQQPAVKLKGRPSDDRSRRAAEQVNILLERWKHHLKEVRFYRQGLSSKFDQPFAVDDVNKPASEELLAAETVLDLLVRTFPFLLVMWSLVGALHPAIDLCAGEKERGTMETLLISPAGRAEIVYGKFLTIWVFSAGTSVLHLISMSLSTWQLREQLPQGAVTWPALFWCVLLVLPMSALFSAICLAIGAYARSSREGQYYLMPLFWVTMPLILLTLSPDVELNQFYSMVPVTGVALLMQRLMIAPSLASVPWFYFLPVFGSILLWSWLALRWAIWQFQREEVLFREAERLNLGLMFRQLFRRKSALPSLAQTLLCFAVLFFLWWLSRSLEQELPLLVRNVVVLLAFVAAPPLFMGLLLTTKPRESLALRLPHPGYIVAALLLLPLAEMAHHVLLQFPALATLFRDRRSFVADAYERLGDGSLALSWTQYLLIVGLLAAACKELAFRGFILSGLRQRFPLWSAILLSGLLFAVYHMNVFALVPFFLLGVACGFLTVRSGSLIPAIVLHTGCNLLLLRGPLLAAPTATSPALPVTLVFAFWLVLATVSATVAGLLLWRLQPMSKGE